MKYLIFYIVMLIAIASYGNIGAIWMWVSGLEDAVYIAMASGVIALIALLFAIVQGWQNYRHNKLSVRPLLNFDDFSKERNNINYDTFHLINSGIGPAIIKKIELFFDDKVISCNDYKTYCIFLTKTIRDFTDGNIGYVPCGDVMSVGQKQLMWTLKYGKTKKDTEFVNKLSLRVEYQSIYEDEIFVFDSRNDSKFHDDVLSK